jgi:hypothetical protein
MKVRKDTKKRLIKGNRKVLEELKKVEGPNRFDMRKMFEHTFGFKAGKPVFMQKTKGGLIFFVSRADADRISKHKIDWDGIIFGGKEADKLKVKNLGDKVIAVVDSNPEDFERILSHERAHLMTRYDKVPGKLSIEQIKDSLKQDLIEGVKSERYFQGRFGLHKQPKNIVWHMFENYDRWRKPKQKVRMSNLEEKLITEMMFKEHALAFALKNLPRSVIIATIKKSKWENIEKNLQKEIAKRGIPIY